MIPQAAPSGGVGMRAQYVDFNYNTPGDKLRY